METKSTDTKDIECAVRTILSYIGDNPEREGLKGTPERIVRMWKELFRGYDPEQAPKITTFPNGKDGLSFNSIVADSGRRRRHKTADPPRFRIASGPDPWRAPVAWSGCTESPARAFPAVRPPCHRFAGDCRTFRQWD